MDKTTVSGRKKIFAALLIFLFAAAVPVLLFYSAGREAVIEEREGNFYRGKNIIVIGDRVFFRRDPRIFTRRDDAIKAAPSSLSFTVRPLSGIRLIEFISLTEEDIKDESPHDPKYLGRYNIIVQGHAGQLVLREKDGKLYGTVRFPKWGNGAVEYLRGIRIGGGKIQFTRSANSNEEIRRLGANYYFTQRFYGTYSASGKNINGYFINDRKEKHLWEAKK